jgi:hypothetical protein
LDDAFKALPNQDLQAIEKATTKLEDRNAKFLREILALRAVQLRKAEVLRYCLELGGFPYGSCFEDEADMVRQENDPLTFKVSSHLSHAIKSSERLEACPDEVDCGCSSANSQPATVGIGGVRI